MLALAAAVERESEHPLAQAIARRADETGGLETGRHGVQCSRPWSSGTGGWPTSVDRQPPPDDDRRRDLGDMGRSRRTRRGAGRTAVLVAVDGRVAGVLALADAPRDTAAAAVRELHAMNIQVVMLTGDNEATLAGSRTSSGLTL